MLTTFQLGEQLPALVNKIVDSYNRDERTRHIDRVFLPSRSETVEIIQLLLEIAYPGYHGRQDLNCVNVRYHVGELLPKIGVKLFRQIDMALCYQSEAEGSVGAGERPGAERAHRITLEFLERIP
ncbi:MAG TPA: serine acetyltransferase, partial [Phycisphaerae bacterium]|nr:serine acetyltransferase [Phycisphaerae bacterium]